MKLMHMNSSYAGPEVILIFILSLTDQTCIPLINVKMLQI